MSHGTPNNYIFAKYSSERFARSKSPNFSYRSLLMRRSSRKSCSERAASSDPRACPGHS